MKETKENEFVNTIENGNMNQNFIEKNKKDKNLLGTLGKVNRKKIS